MKNKGISGFSGITIIALIVTIVVLLILAGITIASITGNESIPNKAAEQRDKSAIAKEQQILENAAISITNNRNIGTINETSLRDALSDNNVEVTKSGGLYRIVFKDTNNLYKMDEDGEFFYWEDMAPQTFYAKLYSDGTLIFSSDANTTYKDCYPNAETDLQPVESYANSFDYTRANVKKVIFHDPVVPTTCQNMFNGCTKIEKFENIEYLHTENVTSMRNMFSDCINLDNLNLKYFDTSKVQSMYLMFNSCKAFTRINISLWDTCNVMSMYGMFANCENVLTIDLSNINTNNVQGSMNFMFNHCYKLTNLDLETFNTQAIESMEYMFNGCELLKTIYVGDKWSVSNVSNSSNMFNNCINLVGSAKTKYNVSNANDASYAHIDGGKDNPGYFTLKP